MRVRVKMPVDCDLLEVRPSQLDGDRVEIYRELTADPKQARRLRARQQRVSRTRR
jgi:putative ubiquitin-RnfH superfamily antitoxin RatB of RatAB toxin-antitoxin module